MDNHQKIIRAASELITDHGLQATSTSLIAKRAGVSNGTLFHYFPTKQKLVYAVLNDMANAAAENVLTDYSETLPVKERFFNYWSAVLRYLLKDPKKTSLLMYLSTTPYIEEDFRLGVWDCLYPTLKKLLMDARKEGMIKDLNENTIAWLLYGALGFVSLNLHWQTTVNQKRIDQIVQVLWDGIKK